MKTNKKPLKTKQKLNEAATLARAVAEPLAKAVTTVAPKVTDRLKGLFAPKTDYPAVVVRPKPITTTKPTEKPSSTTPGTRARDKDITDVPYRDIPSTKPVVLV